MLQDNSFHSSLVQVIKKAPSREWIEQYLNLIKELLDFTGLTENDPRLSISSTKDYGISVNVNRRHTLTSLKKGNSWAGFIFGNDFDDLAVLINKATSSSQFDPFSEEVSEKTPYILRFEGLPKSILNFEQHKAWQKAVLIELKRAKASPYKRFHNPLAYKAVVDLEYRALVLDEAFFNLERVPPMTTDFESIEELMSWNAQIELWVAKHRKLDKNLTPKLIRFFELAFENTRHPEESWFGVHKDSISLVIGGIYLAAINLSADGTWLLIDKDSIYIENVEYKQVQSTQKYIPLIWARLIDIENLSTIIDNAEIWESYSLASEKILNSPISHSRKAEFQQSRQKKRLSEFWNISVSIQDQLSNELKTFNSEDIEDARKIRSVSIVQRQGQSEFRQKLLNAYGSRCVVTGCDAEPALEPAHIVPYKGLATNHTANGLLLRSDIHTLFDLYLLSVKPDTYEVVIAPRLAKTCYQELQGQKLLRTSPEELPSQDALRKHYEIFQQECKDNQTG